MPAPGLRIASAMALACLLVAGCATPPPERIVGACARAPGTWVPSAAPPAQASAMLVATGAPATRLVPGVRDYWLQGPQGRWLLCRADLRRERPGCSTEGYVFEPVGDGWVLVDGGWITVCGY